MPGKLTYRSRIAYLHLVTAAVVTAAVAVIASLVAAAIVGAVGLVWGVLTLRSGIEVTVDGFVVRGRMRTHTLGWSETDAFIVVGYSGETAYFGNVTGGTPYANQPVTKRLSSPAAVNDVTLTHREHMFSLVTVVTSHGTRIKVPGTASSFLQAGFPARAATELNQALKRHNPSATAS